MSQNFQTFRGLLRGAICDTTQAQFANESGISAEHLSRMLNQETINRPTKNTLNKIAAVARNGITYQMLFNALEEEDPTIPAKTTTTQQLTFEEHANETMRQLNKMLEKWLFPYIDYQNNEMETILSALHKSYPKHLPISYELEPARPYIGSKHKDIRYYINVRLSMADHAQTAKSQLIIYYSMLSDKRIIQNISTKVLDINDLYGLPPAALDYAKTKTHGEETEETLNIAYDLDYYLDFQEIQRFKEHYTSQTAKNTEEQLLHKIFGEETTYPISLEGVGFVLPEIPKHFTSFVKQHQNEILKEYEEEPDLQKELKTLLENHPNEDSPENNRKLAKLFDNFNETLGYTDGNSWENGWPAAIANTMSENTSWRFEYQPAKEDPTGRNLDRSEHPCILIQEDTVLEQNINRETLLNTLAIYVEQLGLTRFGDILHHTMKTAYRKPMTYTLREKTQKTTQEKDEPNCHLSLNENRPDKTGAYYVKLKDDRILVCLYLEQHDVWLYRHKDWTPLIQSFDPIPLKRTED